MSAAAPPYKRINARWLYHGPYAKTLTNRRGAKLVGIATTTFTHWRAEDKACRHNEKDHGNKERAEPTEIQKITRRNAKAFHEVGWL